MEPCSRGGGGREASCSLSSVIGHGNLNNVVVAVGLQLQFDLHVENYFFECAPNGAFLQRAPARLNSASQLPSYWLRRLKKWALRLRLGRLASLRRLPEEEGAAFNAQF